MTKPEARERISKLKETISHHRYLYHVLDRQEISEAALDSLKHELYTLEQQFPDLITPDSPTQRVGGQPLPAFKKVTHPTPMLSMEDVFSFEELQAWEERLSRQAVRGVKDYYGMTKLDGLAMSLIYRDGVLATGATRGDGRIGEDVTQNIRTIESVPLRLRQPTEHEIAALLKKFDLPKSVGTSIASPTGVLEVRGEIYMPKKDFDKLNRERAKAGEETFANPRNVSAGSIRQLDPAVAASRPLDFMAWRLETDVGERRHEAGLAILALWGFKVNFGKHFDRLENVRAYFDDLRKTRAKLPQWIDGVVVRVNERERFDRLGVVGKTPRGLVAWKFPPEEVTTVVEEIRWFVGRTGALTPVAIMKPSWVGGTTVKHASLHNFDEVERLDVRVGDTVILYKAGDIIPKIKGVVKNLRPSGATGVRPPRLCPVCGHEVRRAEGEVAIVCSNKRCPAKDRERVIHAVRAFEIDGFGPQTASALLDRNIVEMPSDLFTLKAEDFLELDGFAEVSAKKIVAAIQSKKQITLSRFIVALGIRNVGDETALDLAKQFGTLKRLRHASGEELQAVPGVGAVVAESVIDFFGEPSNQKLIDAYLENGVMVTEEKVNRRQPLAGQSFVLTGSLEAMSRDEAKQAVRDLGGDASESVSRKTSYVIVGHEPGSKADKAKALGVKTLSESEFLRIIGKN